MPIRSSKASARIPNWLALTLISPDFTIQQPRRVFSLLLEPHARLLRCRLLFQVLSRHLRERLLVRTLANLPKCARRSGELYVRPLWLLTGCLAGLPKPELGFLIGLH